MPDDLALQVRAGNVLLSVNRFEDARGRAEKVLAKDPKHVDAQILKGNALSGLRDFSAALTALQTAVETDPGSGIGYTFLGALQVRAGRHGRVRSGLQAGHRK